MAPRCTVCINAEVIRIDREVAAGREPVRHIARRYGLAESSLRRHRDRHLSKALQRALEKDAVEVSADRLVGWTHALHARTLLLLERAEQMGDLANARGLIREARASSTRASFGRSLRGTSSTARPSAQPRSSKVRRSRSAS